MQIKGETSSFTIHTPNETDERQVVIVIGGEEEEDVSTLDLFNSQSYYLQRSS